MSMAPVRPRQYAWRSPGVMRRRKFGRTGGFRATRRPPAAARSVAVSSGARVPAPKTRARRRPRRTLPDVTARVGHSGSANTKRLLPLLGRSSGVIAAQREALPPTPVPAATYWRPSTA